MAPPSTLTANKEDATAQVVVAPTTTSLFKSHSHVVNTTMAFVFSMTFKCAVDLGIPDALQRKGGRPVTLQELAAELAIPPTRTQYLSRVMRVLEHEGYFAKRSTTSEDGAIEGYVLTPASAHLTSRRNPALPTVLVPSMVTPYFGLSAWFRDASPQQQQSAPTPFQAASGLTLWEYAGKDPELNVAFNAALSHDAELIAAEVVDKCGHVLGGVRSLVDVGGGNGALARAISKAFPRLECTVLELPHVVEEQRERSTTEGADRVAYVASNMFEYIPQADVILLKYVLHCYDDEECIKILRQCKKAIPGGGRVVILEVVMKFAVDASEMVVKNQLIMDMVMMTFTGGKERTEKEWADLFVQAGFTGGYKMTPILDDFLCLIEVFP